MENAVTTLAGGVETAETPGRAFPARDKLANARTRYKELNTEISVLESRLVRLQSDEQAALNEASSSSDDEGGYARLGDVRLRIEVHGKRVGHAREAVAKALELGLIDDEAGG